MPCRSMCPNSLWTRPKYCGLGQNLGPFEKLLCTTGIQKKMLSQSSKYWSKIILGRKNFWLVQIIFDKVQKNKNAAVLF